MASSRLHHGWLLAGPEGIGKAGFAHWAAELLLCDAAPERAGQIGSLLAAGSHPDFRVLRRLSKDDDKDAGEGDTGAANLKRNISVDQIRELQPMLANRPALSDRRVIVIDSADDLERSAANALLKSLEEPPAGTIFLLISHAPDRLLPTIRSRCRIVRFEPLSPDQMRQAIIARRPDIEPEELEALVRTGHGSPGAALAFAGLGIDELDREMHAIINGGDPDFALRSELARRLSLKQAQERYAAFLQRVPGTIAQLARHRPAAEAGHLVESWKLAQDIAARAQILNHDKQAVVLEMSRLLASLYGHKGSA